MDSGRTATMSLLFRLGAPPMGKSASEAKSFGYAVGLALPDPVRAALAELAGERSSFIPIDADHTRWLHGKIDMV